MTKLDMDSAASQLWKSFRFHSWAEVIRRNLESDIITCCRCWALPCVRSSEFLFVLCCWHLSLECKNPTTKVWRARQWWTLAISELHSECVIATSNSCSGRSSHSHDLGLFGDLRWPGIDCQHRNLKSFIFSLTEVFTAFFETSTCFGLLLVSDCSGQW